MTHRGWYAIKQNSISFWYMLVLFSAFLSFCTLAFFWGGYYIKMLFSHYLIFLTSSVSHGSLFGSWFGWYALCCYFHVGIDKVFVFISLCMCFRYFLKSIKFVSYSYCVFIYFLVISLLVSENQLYLVVCFYLYFCIASEVSLLWQFCDQKILLQKRLPCQLGL